MPDRPLADRARLWVAERLPAPDLAVSDLAAALGVDRSTLYRRLRVCGTTPSSGRSGWGGPPTGWRPARAWARRRGTST